MKIVCLSDTHSLHHRIPSEWLPKADMIIHAGDICNTGRIEEAYNFFNWFSGLSQYRYKIFCAGNHDWAFERHLPILREDLKDRFPNLIYLQDESIEIEGVKIYGSPWQPEFNNWAFNLPRGKHLQEKWDMIPLDTDVLVTHGPPEGIGDFVPYENGKNVGCRDLLDTIVTKLKIKAHIYGHVHYSYGEQVKNGIHFINASTCTERYEPINKPILFEVN